MAERRLFRVVGTFAGVGDETYERTRTYLTKEGAEGRAQGWAEGVTLPPASFEDDGYHREPALKVTIQRSEPVQWVEEPVEWVARPSEEPTAPAFVGEVPF